MRERKRSRKTAKIFHLGNGEGIDSIINWKEDDCGGVHLGQDICTWFAHVNSEKFSRHQMEMSGIFFHLIRFDF